MFTFLVSSGSATRRKVNQLAQMRAHIAFSVFFFLLTVAAADPTDAMPPSSSTRHCHSDHLQQHKHRDHDHEELLTPSPDSRDWCDCGTVVGCRCSDPIWDMELFRVDESVMEEGMDDQGYRQHA